MNKIKYSIIIPAYNVQDYLEKCISSVLQQKFDNYEIIIIDDGSTDRTGIICDSIGKMSEKIKVIHKKNGGLSSARNAGVEIATGKYTIFLDSDDFWVDETFLSNVNAIMTDEDLVIFNSYKFYDISSVKKPRFKLSKKFYSLNDEKKIEYIIKKNIYKACAWDKIIKTSILQKNEIKFPEGVLSEDMQWCGKILEKVKKVNVYPNVVYAYRQRNNSISKNVNKKHLMDIYEQIIEGIKSENLIVLNYFAYEYIILYSYSFTLRDKEIIDKTKEISWILNYDISNKVKKIKYVYNMLGYKTCGRILEKYLKWK